MTDTPTISSDNTQTLSGALARIAELERIVQEFRQRESTSDGVYIPHNAPITETETMIYLRGQLAQTQDDLLRIAKSKRKLEAQLASESARLDHLMSDINTLLVTHKVTRGRLDAAIAATAQGESE